MATVSSALPAVQCIVNIVKSFGVKAPSPEAFRGAKHNSEKSVQPMLRLLHDVLVLQRADKLGVLCETHAQHRMRLLDSMFDTLVRNIARIAGQDLEPEHLVLPMVQLFLADAGYTSARASVFMAMTPPDCSSRELLLVFGWCMGRFDIVRLWIMSNSANVLLRTTCLDCHNEVSSHPSGASPPWRHESFHDLLRRTVATLSGNKLALHSLRVEQQAVGHTQQKLLTDEAPCTGHGGVDAAALVVWWRCRIAAAERVHDVVTNNLEVWWKWLGSATTFTTPAAAPPVDDDVWQCVLNARATAHATRKRYEAVYASARSKWKTMHAWPEVARKDYSDVAQHARDRVASSVDVASPADIRPDNVSSALRGLFPDSEELATRKHAVDALQEEVAATVQRLQDTNDAQLKLLLLKLPDLVLIQ